MATDKPKVAFFFGAGASIRAGVPDTQEFLTQFLGSLEETSEERLTAIRLRDVLRRWADQQKPSAVVDIELVLQVLDRLANPGRDPLLPFFEAREEQAAVIKPGLAQRILRRLRDFIKAKVTVGADAVGYLKPLRAFVNDFPPLDIYSANYDTCVEVFCSENRLRYRDGFDEAWNPSLLNEPNLDVRLFKVHGSVTWYQTDHGRFVKIPLLMKESSTTLMTGERAENLMLYPAQKYDYAEPLFELLIKMKDALNACHTVFVVGYSFRDEHIRRIFWDVARSNASFHVVLIGPNAWEIYQRKLRSYGNGTIISQLSGRVVCLPFRFEDVLPTLRGGFYRDMVNAWSQVAQFDRSETGGNSVNWAEALIPTAHAWDTEGLVRLFDKVRIEDFRYFRQNHEAIVHGLLQSIGHQDTRMLAYFWKKYQSLLSAVFTDCQVNIEPALSEFTARFGVKTGLNNPLSSLSLEFRDGSKIVTEGSVWLRPSDKLSALSDLMEELDRVFGFWNKGPVKFNVYRDARNPLPQDLSQALDGLSGHTSTTLDGTDRGPWVAEQIKTIETDKASQMLDKYSPLFETGHEGDGPK